MKIFSLKLTLELHTKVKIAAAQKNQSMLEWVIEAITEKLSGE